MPGGPVAIWAKPQHPLVDLTGPQGAPSLAEEAPLVPPHSALPCEAGRGPACDLGLPRAEPCCWGLHATWPGDPKGAACALLPQDPNPLEEEGLSRHVHL